MKRISNNALAGRICQGQDSDLLGFPKSEFVQSLERGLAVIRAFSESNPSRTLSEVAQAVGMTRAAARRFLLTLQALGYVASDGRYFRLCPKTLELGYAYLASLPWWRHAQQVVGRLAGDLKQACAVGVLDRDLVAYVAYASAAPQPIVVRPPGTRLPATPTAIGRVLLSGLPEAELDAYLTRVALSPLTPFTQMSSRKLKAAVALARQKGYSTVDQELEVALRSIGVPVLSRSGSVAAAMSVSVRDPHLTVRDIEHNFLAPLRRASKEITDSLPI